MRLVPPERLVLVGATNTSTPAWAVLVLVLSEVVVLVWSNGVETDEDKPVVEPVPPVDVVVEPVGSVTVVPVLVDVMPPPPPIPPIIPWPLSVPDGLNGNKGAGLNGDVAVFGEAPAELPRGLAALAPLGLSTSE